MDLHVIAPPASTAERAAVDGVISERVGPPTTWHGGTRETALEGHVAHGGHAAREHRDLLLPALHALQDRIGFISQPALGYVSRRLAVPPAEAYGVATFYSLLSTTPRPPVVAHVCDDIACRLAGAEGLCAALETNLGPAGAPAAGGRATWLRSPCLGQCERAPAVLLTVAAEEPQAMAVAPVDASALLARLEAASAGRPAGRDAGDEPWGTDRRAAIRAIGPAGGLRRAHAPGQGGLGRSVGPGRLPRQRWLPGAGPGPRARARARHRGLAASRLVGRGGAAFPTGRKWAAVAAAAAQPHYLVCNADESEPGTFKDRVLLEEDPFAVIEAMTIAAFATRSQRGYLYLRGEYPLALARVSHADRRRPARRASSARPSWARSFAFDIEVRRGAGAYICGEETALFESIEGKRGEPRNKPPFPVEVGLFGKPTIVNNVETLVNVLPIVLRGRRGLRRDGHGGLDRDEALLPLRARGAAGPLRGAVRDDPAARCWTWPAACRAASARMTPSGRSCLAERRASSSGRRRWTPP